MSFFLNPGNLLRSPGLFPAAARAARAAPTAACALSAAELAHGLAQNQEHDDCQNRDDDDICHSPVLSNLAGSCREIAANRRQLSVAAPYAQPNHGRLSAGLQLRIVLIYTICYFCGFVKWRERISFFRLHRGCTVSRNHSPGQVMPAPRDRGSRTRRPEGTPCNGRRRICGNKHPDDDLP